MSGLLGKDVMVFYWVALVVAVVVATEWEQFSVKRDTKVSCHFRESFDTSTTTCVVSCYYDNGCVSASFSVESGRCLLSRAVCCGTTFDENWTTFERNSSSCSERYPGFRCFEEINFCIKYIYYPVKRGHGLAVCREYGAKALSIPSERHQQAVASYLAEIGVSDSAIYTMGKTKEFSNGSVLFTWERSPEMVPVVYKNWDVGVPHMRRHTEKNTCLLLLPGRNNTWGTAKCFAPRPILCQITL